MAGMSSSAIAQRIFIDLKPVVQVQEQITALNDILSGVEGFDDLYWGNNVEALDQLEIILRKTYTDLFSFLSMKFTANQSNQFGVPQIH